MYNSKSISVIFPAYNEEIEPEILNRYRFGDIRHCFADSSVIEKLGFKPQVNFTEGMQDLVNWSKTRFLQKIG